METLQDRSSGSKEESPAPHQRGKLDRIAGHTRGLVEDLREWIDLRIDLAILELEERVDTLRNDIALGIALAFLGFMASLFVLTTVALGLGWMLGHSFWGFLSVSVGLVLLVTVLAQTRPDLVPPSNLFERLRRNDGDASEDRPIREASADVSDRDASESSTSS